MTDIALDLDQNSPTYRDVQIVNGDLQLVGAGPAILQHILQRLGIFLGEWFLDNTIGVPYFQQVLVKTRHKESAVLIDNFTKCSYIMLTTISEKGFHKTSVLPLFSLSGFCAMTSIAENKTWD